MQNAVQQSAALPILGHEGKRAFFSESGKIRLK